jgi:hypothetical protein
VTPQDKPTKNPFLAVNVVSTGEIIILDLSNAVHELPQHWLIGRAKDCAVRLGDSWVSGHHATIRAEPMENGHNYDEDGRRRYVWMLRDNGSTNGTFQGGVKVGGRGCACPWIEIEDNDSALLGRTRIRFSFDGYFTDRQDTDGHSDEPPTLIPPDSTTDIKPPSSSSPTSWADVVSIFLKGPEGFPTSVWWFFLTLAALLALWIWKQQ